MMKNYYETTISFNSIEFLPYVLFIVISLIFIGKLKKLYDLYLNHLLSNYIQDIDTLLEIVHQLTFYSLKDTISSIIKSDEFGKLDQRKCKTLLLSPKLSILQPSVVNEVLFCSKIDFLQLFKLF